MANYATLKATINEVVTTNANNEITGALMRSLLLSAVDALGAGFQYMGIATPSTNPGTPDYNAFYIACTAGTYANFGGVVVVENEVVILKYNGSWTVDNFGVPTKEAFDEVYDIVIGGSWTDTRNAGGSVRALTKALKKGDIITSITGNVDSVNLMSDSSGTESKRVYLASDLPYTCERSFAYWNAYNSSDTSATIVMSVTRPSVSDRIATLESLIKAVKYDVQGEPLPVSGENQVYKLTGAVGSSVPSSLSSLSGKDYIRQPVTPGDIVVVTGGVGSSYGGALTFVDSNGKLLTVAKSTVTLAGYMVEVPTGAVEIIINKTHAADASYIFKQGTSGWKTMSNLIQVDGIADECKFLTSRRYGLVPNPARYDASQTASGYFGGYLVDLTGMYEKGYRYVYFRGSNYTLGTAATRIVRGVIFDSNGNIESRAIPSVQHTQGWQALPLTANSAQLWATYTLSANNSNPAWTPEKVFFQTVEQPLGLIVTELAAANDKLKSFDDDTPILPRNIHAVSGERLLLFKNAIIPGDITKVILSCTGGRDFRRYLNFIPESTGNVTLNCNVAQLNASTTIKVVSPSNPSSQKNILIVGASAVGNYATQFEELYRRLVLTTGNSDVTQFGKTIKDPTNPRGLGLTNINFVGRKTNGNNFRYEATGGYTFANYYGAATSYNYAFTVDDASKYADGAVYSDGTHQFTINEISGADNRVSMQCATQGVTLPASGSLSKVSGSGASSLVYTEYSATLTKPFLNPNTNQTSLSYYMQQYCGGASLGIVYFNGLLFNSGFNWSLLEDYAKPLARVIHNEYPNAKIIFGTGAMVDTRGYGQGYVYKSTSATGQTKFINDCTREYTKRLETMVDALNTEFGSEVCIVSSVLLQCDSDYDYPYMNAPVDNRNTATEVLGTNGIHPTNVGILNQIDAIYRSICYVIKTFFN